MLGISRGDAELCERDGSLIYNLALARKEGRSNSACIRDWISKTRTEVTFFESTDASEEKWEIVHQHWELFLPADRVEATFPYISLSAKDDGDDTAEWEYDEDTSECAPLSLSNGDTIYPFEGGSEYCEYCMRVSLNDRGDALVASLQRMLDAKLLTVKRQGAFISVAPWHAREV
jgi:hypothetical protein